MKHYFIILFSFFLCFAHQTVSAQIAVSNYKTYLAAAKYNDSDILITRKYTEAGKTKYLAVNLDNLETYTLPANKVNPKPLSWEQAYATYSGKPYIKALLFAKTQSFALQDAGVIHGYPKEKGITLTIDLCPSHKSLDRIIFTSLISEFGKTEKPVPVAL